MTASENENFELAASYRVQLMAFEKIAEKQSVIVGEDIDADAIGYIANEENAAFHVVIVRHGKVIGADSFTSSKAANGTGEALTDFLLQYYDGRALPPEILLPQGWDDADSSMNGGNLNSKFLRRNFIFRPCPAEWNASIFQTFMKRPLLPQTCASLAAIRPKTSTVITRLRPSRARPMILPACAR